MTAGYVRGLDLHLDVGEGRGRGRALEAALRDAVRSGRLTPGTRLPGTRSLAADLGLSRGTVVQAFGQLVAEGWLVGVAGSGTVVGAIPARSDPPEPDRRPAPDGTPRGIDLRPGRPDLSAFPRTAWASAVRRALTGSAALLDYVEPAGLPVLRAAVAEHVARTRGVRATPDAVVVTAGFTQALALLARVVHRLGIRRAGVEDPSFARHRNVLTAAGAALVPLPVDGAGADPAALPEAPALALLTPAHQHPYGVVLAPARRSAVVEWARRCDGFVVEDDYDGEFRYDRQPVGAMQPLDPDRVVFAGSVSKTLAPGMRIGWLVVPRALRGPLDVEMTAFGAGVPAVDQLALADLLSRGAYDRHVRRMRLAYRARRQELGTRLAEIGAPPPAGVAAGLHALIPLESAEQERRIVAAAGRAGVRLHGLHTGDYWHRSTPDRPGALVIGYATPPDHAWRTALEALTELLLR
ncbi:GntR family transcriptional regulator/MocR family aminotransferase [Pseudonocardia hierapolitana]|uniref:GntR family transcriptional regulator/MocR family aminotransferase n=1 Tax=Pseudonocardia hierapolitana TaxID=1128676 RepID=A0A561SUY2_9PSEU|nr:PLP-dependent aminotransferase family protein [Pseudonocardia hierapolitana]TWF78664.1 GntR family transcriptional regulator/MocR family aminotransferase [Pseudonocardia hierapolitana]